MITIVQKIPVIVGKCLNQVPAKSNRQTKGNDESSHEQENSTKRGPDSV